MLYDKTNKMEFTNSEIDVKSLPTVDHIQFHSLDKNYQNQLRAESIFLVLLLISSVSLFLIFSPFRLPWTLMTLVICLTLMVSTWLMWIGIHTWRYRGYALRQHDIVFKTGIWFKSTTVVAFNRIQHVEIQQGPLDRLFSVSSLILYTAGGSASDLTIPGLHPDEASKLKDHVTRKSSRDEEE